MMKFEAWVWVVVVFLCVLYLSSCTTFQPKPCSYDDWLVRQDCQ